MPAPLLPLLLAVPLPQENNQPPAGFTALFDGRSLAGWRGRPHLAPGTEEAWPEDERREQQAAWNQDRDAHWRVEDGAIVNDGQGVFLTTVRDYGDFELWVDYRTVPLADSGIYLRATPQVQIWDTREEGGKWSLGADRGSGGLWNNQGEGRFPRVLADRPFGEWNRFRILMVGERVWVWLNGWETVSGARLENYWDREAPLPRYGPIQLQTHGGEIRWRNLFLREIGPEEANRILARRADEGFRPLFTGRDLCGWMGATDGYEVVEGALQCRSGHGGTLATEEEFGDFIARLEIRIPPGGNNGLAIRWPGEGDPAYSGMCELQVLDNTSARYAGLKPWQYHGSVYGMVPAARGYLRPPGTWNFQEVRIQGSRIEVELNGFRILAADLDAVETTPDGREHPGKGLRRGHFGLAGHGDPVAFRNIRIRPLD